MSAPYNLKNGTQLVLLIANNVDSAVVLKDLKIQAMNNASQPPENTKQTPSDTDLSLLYIATMVLLVVTFAAVVIYVKKKKKPKQVQINGSLIS